MRISLYDYVTLECAKIDYINTKYSLEVSELKYCAYIEDGNDEGILSRMWTTIKEYLDKAINWIKNIVNSITGKLKEWYNRLLGRSNTKASNNGKSNTKKDIMDTTMIDWYDIPLDKPIKDYNDIHNLLTLNNKSTHKISMKEASKELDKLNQMVTNLETTRKHINRLLQNPGMFQQDKTVKSMIASKHSKADIKLIFSKTIAGINTVIDRIKKNLSNYANKLIEIDNALKQP